MKRFILFVLFGGFILPVSAQDGADYSFWSDLEDDKKVAFVQGYYTGLARGLKILGQEAARMRNQDKYWSPPFSHENSAKRISEFFTDPMPDYSEIARKMLAKLSGQTHQVMTAFVLLNETGQSAVAQVVTSKVTFKSISDAEIDAYLATGESFDKAGAYAVQDNELHPAASWEGCYSNIIGLPLCRLLEMLKELGHAQIGLAQIGDQPDPQLAQQDQLRGDQLQQRSKAASEFCGATCPSSGHINESRDGNRGDGQ